MTAGLELYRKDTIFFLVDQSPDIRFTTDVTEWNTAAAGLNVPTPKKIKDATK